MSKFEINLRKRTIPEQGLIDDLKRVAKQINQQTLTAAVYDEKGKVWKNYNSSPIRILE